MRSPESPPMKLSIITVVRNDPRVAEAARSVVDQVFAGKLEYIVVDGASSDGTLAALAPFRDRIAHLRSEPDRGLYDAMNKGLALATGEVVGFLHADDRYPHAGVLARVAAAFADPQVQACHGDLLMLKPGESRRVLRYWRSGPFRRGSFQRGWMPPHPTFFVRRDVYTRLGGFDLAFAVAADFELMLRFLEVHGIASAYVPEVLVEMRAGGASNGSLAQIAAANGECRQAFRAHGLTPSPLFVPLKLGRHALQLFRRT